MANNSGVIAGLISCVLATVGILSFGIIFVPLAFIVAIFGSIKAIRYPNLSGIGINILAWILTSIGVMTSPVLMAAIGITALISSWPDANHAESNRAPPASYKQEMEAGFVDREARLEQETISLLARELDEDIVYISQSKIPQASLEIESALAELKNASRAIEESLQTLKAAAGVTPMTCYQAEQKVQYNFEQQMLYNWEQLLGPANSHLRDVIGNLEERLENGGRLVTKTQEDAQNLNRALKARRYAYGSKPVEPSNEQQVVEKYLSVMTSARTQLSAWKSESADAVERARKMMREGESITRNALRSARCN